MKFLDARTIVFLIFAWMVLMSLVFPISIVFQQLEINGMQNDIQRNHRLLEEFIDISKK